MISIVKNVALAILNSAVWYQHKLPIIFVPFVCVCGFKNTGNFVKSTLWRLHWYRHSHPGVVVLRRLKRTESCNVYVDFAFPKNFCVNKLSEKTLLRYETWVISRNHNDQTDCIFSVLKNNVTRCFLFPHYISEPILFVSLFSFSSNKVLLWALPYIFSTHRFHTLSLVLSSAIMSCHRCTLFSTFVLSLFCIGERFYAFSHISRFFIAPYSLYSFVIRFNV